MERKHPGCNSSDRLIQFDLAHLSRPGRAPWFEVIGHMGSYYKDAKEVIHVPGSAHIVCSVDAT